MDALVAPWTGEDEFKAIVDVIEKRDGRRGQALKLPPPVVSAKQKASSDVEIKRQEAEQPATPEQETNLQTPPAASPDPSVLNAPLAPANKLRMPLPAMLTGDLPTPTPSATGSVSSLV